MVDGENGEKYTLQPCDIGKYVVIQWGYNSLAIGETELEAVEQYIKWACGGPAEIGYDDDDEPILSSDPQEVLEYLRTLKREDGGLTIEKVYASE